MNVTFASEETAGFRTVPGTRKGSRATSRRASAVAFSDPDDRLRATEGCFLMTDMADVESVAEPSNNSKVC